VPPHLSDENCKRSKESNHEVVEKSADRFLFDVTCKELDAFKEGEYPINTTKNTEWD